MDGNPTTASSSAGLANLAPVHRQRSQSSTDSEDEDDSDSESSSSKALSDFRKKWQSELKESSSDAKSTESNPQGSAGTAYASLSENYSSRASDSSTSADIEEEAKNLFLMGVGLERQGDLYDAVRCYRRAMQLIPDIEYRVNQNETPANELNSQKDSDSDSESIHDFNRHEEDCDDPDLKTKFLRSIEENGWKFFEKKRPDSKVHLRDFPVEVLTYILRWLVSDELDLRSLDEVSRVSKGFYCLSRDEDIWKLACDRIWDSSEGLGSEFSTYREMFLARPRVRFEGCYISKVTYVRPGEHSFQDQSYRPWHLVEYYRFLRFFPDGHFHFLTTSDQPAVTVPGLRDHMPRNPATLQGKYKLFGDNLISAVIVKPSTNYNNRVGKSKQKTPTSMTTFHMEFQIQELRDRPNWVLRWNCYSVFINTRSNETPNRNPQNNEGHGAVSATNFELSQNKYPPLYFSRVKSYTARSENILA